MASKQPHRFPPRVSRRGHAVCLEAEQGTFSYFHPKQFFTGFSWDALTASVCLLPSAPRRILLLGFGGGTVARQCLHLWPDSHIVGIEADARVIKLMNLHFPLDMTRLTVMHASGEDYLRRTRRRFDVILDDMWPFDPNATKPALTNAQWPSLVRSRLAPIGLYAINVYRRGVVLGTDEFPAVRRALKSNFHHLMEIRPPNGSTTIVAAGSGLLRASEVRAKLGALPEDAANAFANLRYLTLSC